MVEKMNGAAFRWLAGGGAASLVVIGIWVGTIQVGHDSLVLVQAKQEDTQDETRQRLNSLEIDAAVIRQRVEDLNEKVEAGREEQKEGFNNIERLLQQRLRYDGKER